MSNTPQRAAGSDAPAEPAVSSAAAAPDGPQASPPRPGPEVPYKPVISASAAKRANASVRGMILALAVSMLAFLAVMAMNPGKEASSYERDIDVSAVAQQAAGDAAFTPLAPPLPAGWSSNHARWSADATGGVPHWEVGYVTAGNNYIAMTQTASANPTWIAQATGGAPVTGERRIGGRDWQLRDTPDGDTSVIVAFKGSTVVLSGSAPLNEFDVLGSAIVTKLRQVPAASPSAPPAT